MSKDIKRQNAIDALLDSKTLTEAAEKAGITRKTLYNYLRTDKEFARAYKEARERLTLERLDTVEAEQAQAKAVILEIMNDKQQNSATRLKAAQAILDAGQVVLASAGTIANENLTRDLFDFGLNL